VGNDSDDGAILLHSVDLDIERFGVLSLFLVIVGEGLLFGVHPVFIESSQGILGQF